MMPPEQPQARHAEHRREEAAPAAMPQTLRDTGHAHKRPDTACLGGFQGRHIGKHNVTGHNSGHGRFYRSDLRRGGKLGGRDLGRGDSGQHGHQRVAAGLLEDRLARALQHEHARSRREMLSEKELTPAGGDAGHTKLSGLAEMRQNQIVVDIAGHFRLCLVEMACQPCPHDRVQSNLLGKLIRAADMIIQERSGRDRQKRIGICRMPRDHCQPYPSQARHS